METRPRRGLFPFFEGGGVVQPADDRLSCCWSRRSGRACACLAHCIPLHVAEEDDSPVIGCGLGSGGSKPVILAMSKQRLFEGFEGPCWP